MVGCIFIMSMDVWASMTIFTYYRTREVIVLYWVMLP